VVEKECYRYIAKRLRKEQSHRRDDFRSLTLRRRGALAAPSGSFESVDPSRWRKVKSVGELCPIEHLIKTGCVYLIRKWTDQLSSAWACLARRCHRVRPADHPDILPQGSRNIQLAPIATQNSNCRGPSYKYCATHILSPTLTWLFDRRRGGLWLVLRGRLFQRHSTLDCIEQVATPTWGTSGCSRGHI
jgi:hypothetical protein